MSIFRELRRRNVFRVGAVYIVAAWALLQFTDIVSPLLGLPEWAPKLVFVLLAIGLVPALIFAWAFELTAEGIRREKDVDRSASIAHVTGRKLDFLIIGVLAVAIALLLVERFAGRDDPEAVAVGAKSIAVLPFENMSSDAEQEYFSDGIAEEILNALATVHSLKVAGRTSSFAFKGKNEDLRRIGATLGVSYILEGSVRKAGNRVRVTAQLIKVDDGFHAWSQVYEKELNDIFAIQDEIATSILVQLKARLLQGEADTVASKPTDPEVYNLYLLARQRIYTREQGMLESAAELLDKAIATDAEYAPAYAQRAIVMILLSDQNYGTIPDGEAIRRAKPFIDRALELDSELAEAWAALGVYHLQRTTEHEQAIHALTKALSINPSLIEANNWLYLALQATGDMDGARQVLEDLTQRDPLFTPAFINAVTIFHEFNMPEKATALIDRYSAYDANSPELWRAQAMDNYWRGHAAKGVLLIEKALPLMARDANAHFFLSVGLWLTQQLERLADDGSTFFRVDALRLLGRNDDALNAAFQLAARGDIAPLLFHYNATGQSKAAVEYVEERWPGLEQFAAAYPPSATGYPEMLDLAFAYRRQGNMDRYASAMNYVENALNRLREDGVDNFLNLFETARYFAVAGDNDAAIANLQAALQRGFVVATPISETDPVFEKLKGDPRLAAAEQSMLQRVNRERDELGLSPIAAAGTYRHP